MMRVIAIFKRILLQRLGDRRSLVLLFVAPLVILGLLYLLLQVPSNQTFRVGLQDQTTSSSQESLTQAQLIQKVKENKKFQVVSVQNGDRATLNQKDLAAVITVRDQSISLTYANIDSNQTQVISSLVTMLVQASQAKQMEGQIKQAIQTAIQETLPGPDGSGNPGLSLTLPTPIPVTISSHYLYGSPKLNPFDNLAPVLVAFFVFLFVFLISGISLVNERASGTLIRMLVTPVRRSEIVIGYTLAYGLLAILQTGLVLFWARYVLHMQVLGSFAWVILINLLIAMIALLFGLLLSSLAKTEFQFIQFIPIVVVPQFLFSGIISVGTMSPPLQWISHIMPLYYGVDALQKIIKQGMGINQIGLDLAVLFALALVLYLANILALKSLRRT